MPDTTPNLLPRLLKAREVADATGLAPARVYELCREGHFPCIRFGRSLRFDAQVVRDWLPLGGTAVNGDRG